MATSRTTGHTASSISDRNRWHRKNQKFECPTFRSLVEPSGTLAGDSGTFSMWLLNATGERRYIYLMGFGRDNAGMKSQFAGAAHKRYFLSATSRCFRCPDGQYSRRSRLIQIEANRVGETTIEDLVPFTNPIR